MKITLSWLKDYLETDASLGEITDRLSMLGLVVDEVFNPADQLKSFHIAHVIEATPHPDADRLKICKVQTADGIKQVVCGAANARTGLKGVFAPVGTVIPVSGVQLKVSKIRGVESFGMLCSEAELGLGEDSKGIIEISEDAPIGENYASYVGLDDPVIDIEITPNRGDCFGVYGIARDLAASGIGTLKALSYSAIPGSYDSPIKVTISSKNCSVFSGRLIRNIQNTQSPEWMKRRLQAVGLRPISAIVDITNYLCYALGRPMHVFDADKISGNMHIREASSSENLKALNEENYLLNNSMTVISDDHQALSIAGIIGGEESGCTDATHHVFIESAVFDPVNITMTGRKLNINTDSRCRFERGVDLELVQPALEIATQFIVQHCGGEASHIVTSGALEKKKDFISFDPKRVKALTGVQISSEEMKNIFQKLGLAVESNSDPWKVTPPSWRHDLKMDADLVEEILRIVGYDHLPVTWLPRPKDPNTFESYPGQSIRYRWAWNSRKALCSRGLDEATTWSFLKKKTASLFGGGEEKLQLTNPISQDLSTMRPSLLPNLIEASQRNFDRGIPNVSLFEVGSQFHGIEPGEEITVVTGIRTGKLDKQSWLETERDVDLFDVKADVLSVLEICGVDCSKVQTSSQTPSWYHPGRSGAFMLGPKNILAYFGELHPQIMHQMDIGCHVVGFEVFLSNIPFSRSKKSSPLKISPFQPVERDFSFVIDEKVPGETIIQTIRKTDRDLITDVKIFDVYQGKGVEEGKKSIAVTMRLEPQKATLTDEIIQTLSEEIIENVHKRTGGILRS